MSDNERSLSSSDVEKHTAHPRALLQMASLKVSPSFAKAGTHGAPVLKGSGPFTPDTINTLTLTNALENTGVMLVASLSPLYAPFKDSVLVPAPDILVPLSTNSSVSKNQA